MKQEIDEVFEKVNEGSFRFDAKAKSFQLTGFRWRYAPALIVGLSMSFLLCSGLNLAWAGLKVVLPAEAVWFLLGLSVGYLLDAWFGSRPETSSSTPTSQPLGQQSPAPAALHSLSASVRATADDGRKLEAVKLLMEENGLGLKEAKAAIESYLGEGT